MFGQKADRTRRRFANFVKCLGLLFGLVLLVLQGGAARAATSPPAMIVPGQLNVSATGAATYTIPIAVPPGSAGMVPALSLEYSSQSGNGIEGLGWTLNGLPSITRCPRTLAQDGVHGSVNYDSNDKFCMEGQRLIYVSGGSGYGTDGSQYRTEVESFSEIIEHNAINSSNVWFEVWTKSGQHMQFGKTSDSAVLTVGLSTNVIRAWAVNQISDTVGNYLTVTYNCASGPSCTDRTVNGEAYPVSINYTGNSSAGVSPYNSVQFVYGARADTIPMYQAGALTETTVILSDIKTYQGANLVHDYRLAYRAGSSVTHSRLTSVTLCDNASNCLSPTTFGWQGGAGYETLNPGVLTSVAQDEYAIPGTYNGNGITDVLPLPPSDFCPQYYNAIGGPNFNAGTVVGTFTNYGYGYVSCINDAQTQTIVAPNGASHIVLLQTIYDGTSDASYAYPLNSTGNPTGGTALYLGLGYAPPAFAADLNGDGLTDLLVQLNPNSKLYLNSTSGWLSPTSVGGLNPATTTVVTADFNGDGCADTYAQTGSTATITYYCNPAVASSTISIASGYTPVFGDFNGDGKTDILFVSQSGAATLWLSTGTGFTEVNSSVASGSTGSSDWGKYVVYVGDWNGDGKADILLVAPGTSGNYGSGTSHKFYISTGTDFTPAVDSGSSPITISNSAPTAAAAIADWNSDGATDVWLKQPATVGGDAIYNFSYTPELMTSVSNGIGSNTVISYAPINTNGSLYTKSTSATYPTQDVNGALYVVSQVDASNGLGTCTSPGGSNCYTSKYAYAGAQTDLHGRGFLGFATVTITDTQTNIVQTTNYVTSCYMIGGTCYGFPYTGLITSQTKKYAGNTHNLSEIDNTYSDNSGCGSGISPPAGVYQACLTQSVTSGWDYNDTAQLPTTTTNYTYDSYGNALTVNVSVYDPTTSTTSYKNTTNTYNDDTTNWFLGRLLTTSVNSVVGASNMTRQSSFAYSPTTGLLTQESIEPGVSTCNAGSAPCELDTSYTYDTFGHRITTTVSGSGITTRTSYAFYDSLGEFQTAAANALGQYEFWSYDARFGGPVSHTGPNNLVTNWSYDSFGRMTQEVRPDGTQTNASYAYCSGSCPTYGEFYSSSVIDGPGGSPQVGPQSNVYYDMLSRAIANDSQGFDGSNIRVATVYDANGRVQETSRPYFTASASPAWTQFAYDNLGRVTQATFPDTSHTTYGYNGLITTITNNLSQTTTTTKNAQGLVASVEDANSNTTSYVYDAFGDQLMVTDPLGNAVSNTFDIRGNKVVSADPDMGEWTYTYDVLSELTSQTDAKSQATTLTYDILGRPLNRTEPSQYSAWTYGTSASNHNIGKIVVAEACPTPACSTYISNKTYVFDNYGRESQYTLETPSDYFGYGTIYNSSNGQIASITYPSGYTVNRSYNSTGFLTQLSDASAPVWTINARDAELHITSQTAGNNVITTQTFNPNTGLIVTQQAGASAAVANFSYTFDTIGNLTSRSDANESYSEYFCYDSLNRLTNYNLGSACTGGTTVGYNVIGNITSKSDTGTYSYSGTGPHAVSSIAGTVDGLTNPQYSYDPNGNLTCVSTGGGCSGTIGRSINLTSFNMVASIDQGSNSLSMTYDDQHQRLQQVNTVSGTTTTTTFYLNDAASGAMSQRVTVAGTTPTDWGSFNWGGSPWGGTTANALPTWTDYITIDGQIVAQRNVQYPLASAWGLQNWGSFNWGPPPGNNWGSFNWGAANWSGNVVSWAYFNLDHLGSVSVITDQGGNVIQRLSFDPWGKQRNPNGTSAACGTISAPTTRGYTNQEEMPTQCLVNLNARLYDASIGKFMAPDPMVGDPLVPNAFNRYAYVLNNPLSFTDPSGLCFLGCFWKSPVFAVVLDVAAFAIGQPELAGLEDAAGLTSIVAPSILAVANGAILGAATAGITGGNILKSAGLAGLQAGLFNIAGDVLQPELTPGSTAQPFLGSTTADVFVAHGLVGGIVSAAGGGNFGSGFLAAGVASFAPSPVQGQPFDETVGGITESAILGGAGSVLGGGKFANGAETGAFGYLFNDLSHLNHTVQGATAGTVVGAGTALGCDIGTVGICTLADPVIVGAGSLIGGVGGLISDTIESGYDWLKGITYSTPPDNAWDANGPKAPGYPGGQPGYSDPKGGPNWVPNPNGAGNGWESGDGTVWVPTGWAGAPGTGTNGPAHGGPHWDVQDPKTGGHINVKP